MHAQMLALHVFRRHKSAAALQSSHAATAPAPGVQVGVVGRTGSGKSTLLLALYRMFNLEVRGVTWGPAFAHAALG